MFKNENKMRERLDFLIIYYKPEYIVKYSGYAVKENVIEKNLKAANRHDK